MGLIVVALLTAASAVALLAVLPG